MQQRQESNQAMGGREMSEERSNFDERRRHNDSWHLSKTISLSQILTILSMLVVGIWYAALIDKRIAIIEAKEVVSLPQHQGLETRIALLEQYSRLTTSSLERIEGKLDRLVERYNDR
jgi:hypothetical protein